MILGLGVSCYLTCVSPHTSCQILCTIKKKPTESEGGIGEKKKRKPFGK